MCLFPRTDNLASGKTLLYYFDNFSCGMQGCWWHLPNLWHTQQLTVAEWSAQGPARILLPRGKCHPAKWPGQAMFLCNWTSDGINSCPVQLPRQGLNCTDCCYCWPPCTCWAGIWTACVEIASDEDDLCAHKGRLRHTSYLLQTWPSATESIIDLFTLTENK